MATRSSWGIETNLNLDSSFNMSTMLSDSGKISLSDIIAATIGEDANIPDAINDDKRSIPVVPDVTENSNSSDSISQYGFYQREPIKKECEINSTDFCLENSNACDSFNMKHTCNGGYQNNIQTFNTGNSNLDFSIFKKETQTQGNCVSDLNSVKYIEKERNNLDEELLSFLAKSSSEQLTLNEEQTRDQQVVPEFPDQFLKTSETNGPGAEDGDQSAVSYDSDLEDSIQFVDPDDSFREAAYCTSGSNSNPNSHESDELYQSRAKRFRPMGAESNTCPFPITTNFKSESCDPLDFISDNSMPSDLNKSFSTKFVTPTISRSRSFSEASKREDQSPLGESRFNISLSSLLGSPLADSPLSNNPFFKDLKSILESDCKNSDYPVKLFETLTPGQKQDVYTRERNLQAKFSSLQSRYPEEVRNLSSFYRCQSAEVETERFRQLHGEKVPTSYRNYLNDYYDDQLHKIMDRVEKSVKVLSEAKRETMPINRLYLRSRPLLSRKAVAMMDEWYTRNFEHPYPNQSAVDALAKAGEISVEQVKKWFANKRNRCKNTKPQPEIANMKRKRQYSSRW